MSPHLLLIGGEDHYLRIPFILKLRDRGFHVSVADSGSPLPFTRAGIRHFEFKFNRLVSPKADIEAISRLRSLIAEIKPDIVHSFDTKPNILVPLAARLLPGVLVIRTINGLGWVHSSTSPTALLLRLAYRFCHKVAATSTAATVFQNKDDLGYFRLHNMLGPGSIYTVQGSGIDTDLFQHTSSSNTRLRKDLGLDETSPVVLTVARLTRQKGIATLLRAVDLIHRIRPDVRFLLVGPTQTEGPFAISKRELDGRRPYVISTGSRQDVAAILKLATLFAFPTEYREGVPRVLLEAAASGVPIVTTNAPGCSDVVEDRVSGRLVPRRDPKLLAEAILDVLEDKRAAKKMADNAYLHVKKTFDVEIVIDQYQTIYDVALSQGTRKSQTRATYDAVQSGLLIE